MCAVYGQFDNSGMTLYEVCELIANVEFPPRYFSALATIAAQNARMDGKDARAVRENALDAMAGQ